MEADRQKTWLLLVFLIIWAVLLLLTACSVERRTEKKTAWLIARDKLSTICARTYPTIDSNVVTGSISSDTLYKEGSEVILHDTIFQRGDTIIRIIEKKCPPERTIVKTVRDSIFIYRTNTAEVERLKGELLSKDRQINQKDDIIIKQQVKIDKNDWWKTACIITWCIVFTGFIFRFFVIKRPI